jgi:hypothetical protein
LRETDQPEEGEEEFQGLKCEREGEYDREKFEQGPR